MAKKTMNNRLQVAHKGFLIEESLVPNEGNTVHVSKDGFHICWALDLMDAKAKIAFLLGLEGK